jgi:hypothetical protein
MNPGEEFRRYMKAIDAQPEGGAGAHPSAEQRRAYVEQSLGSAEREGIDRHLRDCARCAEAMRDLRDFFEAPRDDERELSEIEIASAWTSMSRRLPPRQARSGWAIPPSALALAASVVVAVGLGVSTLRLERRYGELERQLKARETRVHELETENQRLQEKGSSVEAELSELESPQPNALLFDLFSTDWVQRSGGGNPVAELVLPQDARNFVLILSGEGRSRSGEHVLEIVDENGRAIWRGEGLRQDPQGNFVLTLRRSFLSDGDYRLVLYGKRSGQLTRMAEYAVRVKSR